MHRLINDRPDDFLNIQHHGSDIYETTWSRSRITFLRITGYPTTWFDGMIERRGAYLSDDQMYTWYNSAINSRLGVPTDVTIEVSARETGADTYEVSADVGIEAGGAGKTMRVHLGQVLDYYPSSTDFRYRNCSVQGYQETITLAAGESTTVSTSMTLSGASADDIENVKFVAWAEATGAASPNNVYQSAKVAYPFSAEIPGDVDGDGDVDLSDLAALLAAYDTCEGDTGFNPDADFDGDGCVGLADLAVLLAGYAG